MGKASNFKGLLSRNDQTHHRMDPNAIRNHYDSCCHHPHTLSAAAAEDRSSIARAHGPAAGSDVGTRQLAYDEVHYVTPFLYLVYVDQHYA